MTSTLIRGKSNYFCLPRNIHNYGKTTPFVSRTFRMEENCLELIKGSGHESRQTSKE